MNITTKPKQASNKEFIPKYRTDDSKHRKQHHNTNTRLHSHTPIHIHVQLYIPTSTPLQAPWTDIPTLRSGPVLCKKRARLQSVWAARDEVLRKQAGSLGGLYIGSTMGTARDLERIPSHQCHRQTLSPVVHESFLEGRSIFRRAA